MIEAARKNFLERFKKIPIALLAASPLLLHAEQSPDFSRDVRPILSQNCLKCHGVDDKARKGGLRLDDRTSATKPAKSDEIAIVPGKPEESELVKRIFSDDPDEKMPPPAAKKTLTDAEKKTLRAWIAAGAEYKPHWAFVAPRQAALPSLKRTDWAKNPIDNFVLARLETEKMEPSPEAGRHTLARRVYLDLTGLPPSPEEADAFAKDITPDAYEKLVDRLLASPRYGERWARRWLDLARYADSNGYQKDAPRSIWPWRDWVIRALNADMPFDQFTIKQLAGDLLPNATADDRIATGFHRNTMLNDEGGIDPLEFRFYSIIDRTNTTGTAWLGLTVGCAQCHTHKYDPILHTEYYGLFAFMNNTDEPDFDIADADVEKRRVEAEKNIAKLVAALPQKWPVSKTAKWETPDAKVSTASGAQAEKQADGSWKFSGDAAQKDSYTFEFEADGTSVDRIRIEAIRDGNAGPGRTTHGNFVLTGISVAALAKETPDDPQPVKIVRAEADFSQEKYAVENAIEGDGKTGWAIDDKGAHGGIQSRTATFFFEKPQTLPRGTRWVVKLDQQFGQQHTLAHTRVSLGTDAESGHPPETVRRAAFASAFDAWEKQESDRAVNWTTLHPVEAKANLPYLTVLADDSVLAAGDQTKSDTYEIKFKSNLRGVTALRLEALPDDSLPGHGPGRAYFEGPKGDFFLSEISATANGNALKFGGGSHDRAQGSFAAKKVGAQFAFDGEADTGWSISDAGGEPHEAVFNFAEPVDLDGGFSVKMLFERHYPCGLGRFRISATTDPKHAEVSEASAGLASIFAKPRAQRTADENAKVLRRFLETAPELAQAREPVQHALTSLPKPAQTLVLTERPAAHPRETHRHHRGEFLQEEEKVEAITPSFLPPMADAKHDRLALAHWLVSPENPLTARVTVNRQWQAFFGRGIVRTLDDFGFQGELPSHPELLDWLAVEFVKQGWSMKKLHRLIVTSATYRQSSAFSKANDERDPQNVLLSRGPRFRMDAELLRDSTLLASGSLDGKMGGPGVKDDPGARRRTIYLNQQRTTPFDLLTTFDAPSGERCLARREVSDTPLQALMLLNDRTFVLAAQGLGDTLAARKEPDEARAAWLFRRILIRPPQPDELAMLVDFYRNQKARFTSGELDPKKVAGKHAGDPAECAAWAAVARAVLNLDEAVTKS